MGGLLAFLIIFLLLTVVSLQLVNIYYPPTAMIESANPAPVINAVDIPVTDAPVSDAPVSDAPSTGPPMSEDPRDYQGSVMPLDSSYGWWGGEDNWLAALSAKMDTVESALLRSNTGNTGNVTPIAPLVISSASNASGFLDISLHPYQ
jgi:hypothetical protein